ncbi:MAG: prepilin-type N-terminal cleavage/methylation domain-containing protein, partial [Verrucomicrobiales bacterium]
MRKIAGTTRSSQGGFSLFEIVVAMTILGVISGSVLSILWQAGDTAREIRELDQRDEEVSRFIALLRETIENLPADGTISMKPAEETTSGYPELIIENSATGFVFGEIVGSSEETVISLRPGKVSPDGQPTFDLALSRSEFEPDDTDGSGMVFGVGEEDFLQSDDDGRYWLPLLTGVTAASWNFWDEEQQAWIDEWTDDEKMPVLLAFSLDDAYRPVPLRVVFEVPEQASNPETAATTPTSAPTSTSTVQPAGGNGTGGGNQGGGN